MPLEIEHKFLVTSDDWKAGHQGVPVKQGYLSREAGRTVRVRLEGNEAWLTIKGPRTGLSNLEFEYSIPVDHAEELMRLCPPHVIDKTRYEIPFAGKIWEVDVFHGANAGLIVAEIELQSEDEPFERPSWVGADVSFDPRYHNSRLSEHPYTEW